MFSQKLVKACSNIDLIIDAKIFVENLFIPI